jgi:hypothetical protein
MPVYRFRTIEEMNRFSPPEPSGSLDDRIISALNLGRALSGHRFPPGVHKAHSITEMTLLRDHWESERVRSLPENESHRR